MALEIFPVIHVNEKAQAIEQSEVALEADANGVYLIDHNHHGPETLLDTYNAVVERRPDHFIGLNFLQLDSGASTFSFIFERVKTGDMARLPDGIWVDDAEPKRSELVSLRKEQPELAKVLYLGGVAFKYTQNYTDNPEQAMTKTRQLLPYVDVVTTSGEGTGKPPSPEKVRAMKQATGDKRLAVASGISTDNIQDYSGLFDQLLVSTSIEVEPYSGVFVPEKLKLLIELAQTL